MDRHCRSVRGISVCLSSSTLLGPMCCMLINFHSLRRRRRCKRIVVVILIDPPLCPFVFISYIDRNNLVTVPTFQIYYIYKENYILSTHVYSSLIYIRQYTYMCRAPVCLCAPRGSIHIIGLFHGKLVLVQLLQTCSEILILTIVNFPKPKRHSLSGHRTMDCQLTVCQAGTVTS
jgi:hypothetical protein